MSDYSPTIINNHNGFADNENWKRVVEQTNAYIAGRPSSKICIFGVSKLLSAILISNVNGGVKTCHWGGAKVGQFGVRALELAALK